MKLESQVCSLDLAKRLKELGVKQESCFFWSKYNAIEDWELKGCIDTHALENISAFTVAELGEMLPMGTKFEKYSCKGKPRFCVIEVESIANMSIHDHNEADARARMYIYLIEQGLVKL